jgi:hypothetical protein
MLAATFIATIFVPLFFSVFARRQKMGGREDVATHAPPVTHKPQEAD